MTILQGCLYTYRVRSTDCSILTGPPIRPKSDQWRLSIDTCCVVQRTAYKTHLLTLHIQINSSSRRSFHCPSQYPPLDTRLRRISWSAAARHPNHHHHAFSMVFAMLASACSKADQYYHHPSPFPRVDLRFVSANLKSQANPHIRRDHLERFEDHRGYDLHGELATRG